MTALSPADRELVAAARARDAYIFRTNMPGVNYDPFDGIVNDRRALLSVIDRLEARIAALETRALRAEMREYATAIIAVLRALRDTGPA